MWNNILYQYAMEEHRGWQYLTENAEKTTDVEYMRDSESK
jgi:hypothetical protein